jgi:hypothetical protein
VQPLPLHTTRVLLVLKAAWVFALWCLPAAWVVHPMRSHRPQPLPNPCQSSGRNLAALLCLQGVIEVIEGPERMAIFLSFLATGETYSSISTTYDVSPATVINCVKEGVELFRQHLVPAEIKVPSGAELQQVMVDFEALCSMPQCCGAIDGTFMKINKPVKDGDAFYCYKKYPAIIIFAMKQRLSPTIYCNHRLNAPMQTHLLA